MDGKPLIPAGPDEQEDRLVVPGLDPAASDPFAVFRAG